MATTTNYAWETPDDTDLVKDGAAAIRTLGSSVDTTTKALNPSTTLGDIEYRSATANTNTRLGIGTAGQALVVSAGVPAWADISSGANWSLLNAGGTTLTGAQTITVSGISAKDKIMVIVQNASSASDSSVIGVRLNTDTGSNYAVVGFSILGGGSWAATNLSTTTSLTNTNIFVGRMSTSNTSQISGTVLLTGCNSSGVKVYQASGSGTAAGQNAHLGYSVGGYYDSSSTISSVSLFSGTGNFDGGTVYVYASA